MTAESNQEGSNMTVAVATLEQRAKAAEDQAARLRKIADLAQELGDEGLAELAALLREESVATGTNGHTANGSNGNGERRSYGNRYTAATPEIPRGREAVRRIVRERPGRWTLAELRAEMKRLGWLTSPGAVEAAAKRLCDINGEGRRIGPGRYIFPADYEPEFKP